MIRLDVKQFSIEKLVKRAAEILESGGMVVYPTETCYGMGVDATNERAVEKLLLYKRRREGKPLSVMVASEHDAEKLVELSSSAKNLYKRFLPGPMTVISRVRKNVVAKEVASEMNTLGIRISSHPLALALARYFKKPITATSANASNKRKPYSIEDLLKPLSKRQVGLIDMVLDYGELPRQETSTVVDTTIVSQMVLRPGAIKAFGEANKLVTKSLSDTKRLAQTLMLKNWDEIKGKGLVVGLVGKLGVGKTVFAKGVGKFFKIFEPIVSPSYSLINEYEYDRHGVSGIFYHLDVWRLTGIQEIKQLRIAEMLGAGNVVVVEWVDKSMKYIESIAEKKKVKFIKIMIEEVDEKVRQFRIM